MSHLDAVSLRLLGSLAFLVVSYFVMRVGGLAYRKLVRAKNRAALLPSEIWNGTPALLYFWTLECAQCRIQESQIAEASSLLGQSDVHVEVKKIHAVERSDVARQFNVLTVPTTIVVDRNGDVTAVNPGLTTAKALVRQLQSVHKAQVN